MGYETLTPQLQTPNPKLPTPNSNFGPQPALPYDAATEEQ